MRVVDRDDHIQRLTRGVSYTIAPVLIVAFAVLYPVPAHAGRLFAWNIAPAMTSMVLGAAYLGGAYFFVRAARASAWHTVKGGFPPVAAFAALLGLATIIHWDRFRHMHVAFWLWALLYFTTPFLIVWVYLRNGRTGRPISTGDALLPAGVATVTAAVGVLALGTGLLLFLTPAVAMRIWPWPLTPLTARVLGAILCLGLAGVGSLLDRRWSSARLPFQVAAIMLTLMVVAGVRAHAEFDASNPLTWVFAAGFGGLTASVILVYGWMERTR
ncbi:hypothetical protein [Krasilnikovia sp. M28-CT-15]|uniref:hypothetical protein n=1 Tax=Krasilnikovia sp. M28-CT-15 TaxID=3373540 RepID=UPI003875B783